MICKICGKEFPSRFGKIYCSDECRKEHLRRYDRARRKKAQNVLAQKPCKECGKLFLPSKPYQLFCSLECGRSYQNALKRIDNAKLGKKSGVLVRKSETECANCGKEFKPAYKGERFCSDKCRIQFFHLGEEFL